MIRVTHQTVENCGSCASFKRAGRVYVEDHCKDTASDFPEEHVEPTWWCPRYSRKDIAVSY